MQVRIWGIEEMEQAEISIDSKDIKKNDVLQMNFLNGEGFIKKGVNGSYGDDSDIDEDDDDDDYGSEEMQEVR